MHGQEQVRSASRATLAPSKGHREYSTAILVGNSDGIGLATTRALLAAGWHVTGISRSPSAIDGPTYRHFIADVNSPSFEATLQSVIAEFVPDVYIYCAGTGAPVLLTDLAPDIRVFGVNLMGAVVTAAAVIPSMVNAGAGHFVVLSSQSDGLRSTAAPSYAASKAGMSLYFESLALALRKSGVAVTNIRFGFVDTKMAKANLRPFLISPDEAAIVVVRALKTRPARITHPLRMALLVWILGFLGKWRVRMHSLRSV